MLLETNKEEAHVLNVKNKTEFFLYDPCGFCVIL